MFYNVSIICVRWGSSLNKPVVIHSITCSERDENGFADTYVNGKNSNVRMLLWTEEEIECLHKIADKIHNTDAFI